MYIIFIILIFLLILAFIFEFQDYQRIGKRPDIKSAKDTQLEYEFYSCFNYDNNIYWRSIYIASILAVFAIWYILYVTGNKISVPVFLIIFLVIFFIFYGVTHYKTFHLYRVMCNKARPDKIIL